MARKSSYKGHAKVRKMALRQAKRSIKSLSRRR